MLLADICHTGFTLAEKQAGVDVADAYTRDLYGAAPLDVLTDVRERIKKYGEGLTTAVGEMPAVEGQEFLLSCLHVLLHV